MNFEKNSNHIREITLSLGKYSALGSFNLKPTGSPFLLKKKKSLVQGKINPCFWFRNRLVSKILIFYIKI